MKITKQRLKEIIKEELSLLENNDDAMHRADLAGPGIEDYPEPEEDDPSGSSEEAMTVTRPFLAMTDAFAQYLRDNEVPSEYDAIKQHFIDLGLAPGHAGIYALYGAESFGLEEVIQSGGKPPKPPDQHSEVGYDSTKLTRKTFHKAARAKAKRELKPMKKEGKKASKSVGDPPYREQGSTESQAQQMAAGIALSARRGKTPVGKLKGASKDLYHGKITTKELRNLAKLGQKVKGHKSKEPKRRKSLPGHVTPAKD